MTADRIPVGYVLRAHGIEGDLLVKVLSDHPDRYVPGARFYTDGSDRVTVGFVRKHKEGLIVGLDEIADRTAAEGLAKSTLLIDAADRRDLETDEYWPDDLVGFPVRIEDGSYIGTVVDVVLGAAQDRLVVEVEAGHRIEIPFVADLVDAPTAEGVVVRLPAGLFDQTDH